MSAGKDLGAHLRYFAELGVEGLSASPEWRARPMPSSSPAKADVTVNAECVAEVAAPTGPLVDAAGRLRLLREHIGECTRCKLHAGRTNLVFGIGNPDASLMFIGEGPGADEDEQGEPFVGRAGQLLTQIVKAMGYAREDVYIANVVKCRPPNNRNPEPDEIETCSPFLRAQIASIQPRVIVALGKFAAQTLLGVDTPISRLRGRFHEIQDVPVMPTFHPSYLLRNPSAKRDVWDDMKMVMAKLAE